MDYEPEGPARFSPVEEDIYSDEDDYPAHGDGPEDNIHITDDFPPIGRRVQTWRGGNARNYFQEGGGGHSRKTSRSIGVGNPYERVIFTK